jgi:hypothetical protein
MKFLIMLCLKFFGGEGLVCPLCWSFREEPNDLCDSVENASYFEIV